MNNTYNLNFFSLVLMFCLLLIPIAIFFKLKLKLTKASLISCVRMSAQLIGVGFYLKYLFLLKNPFVNIAYIIIMLVIAAQSVLSRSKLKLRYMLWPIIFAFVISITFMLLVFTVIFDVSIFKNTRYIIPLSGMLLGNLLKGNVIAISYFWQNLKSYEHIYIHNKMLGASNIEAVTSFFKKAFTMAVQPQIAGLATMGLVALPGMMTGQILGGVNPSLAIKYQILIMLAIFVTLCLSVYLSILLTMKTGITKFGKIDYNIYTVEK